MSILSCSISSLPSVALKLEIQIMKDLREVVQQCFLNRGVALEAMLTDTKKFAAVCPAVKMFTNEEKKGKKAYFITLSALLLIFNKPSPALGAIEKLTVVAFLSFTTHSFSIKRPDDSTISR